jgi:hypothetical protein
MSPYTPAPAPPTPYKCLLITTSTFASAPAALFGSSTNLNILKTKDVVPKVAMSNSSVEYP